MTDLQFPPIKFCPSCGSQELEPPFEGHEEHAQKTGGKFGECSRCHTHFTVSGFHSFVIPTDEPEIADLGEDDGDKDLPWVEVNLVTRMFRCRLCHATKPFVGVEPADENLIAFCKEHYDCDSVLAKALETWLQENRPNLDAFVGRGTGRDGVTDVLIVYVREGDPNEVPDTFSLYPVEVEFVGPIEPA